eukprot:g5075.t1
MAEPPTPAAPNTNTAIVEAFTGISVGIVKAMNAAQLPVPSMPKLRRAKGGDFCRQEFLREAELAISLSQRPVGTYMPGPILEAMAAAGDTSWLRRARATATEVGAIDKDSMCRFLYLLAVDADPTAAIAWSMQEATIPEPVAATVTAAQQLRGRAESDVIIPTTKAGAHLQRGRERHEPGRKSTAKFKDKGAAALRRPAERWALRAGPEPVRRHLLRAVRAAKENFVPFEGDFAAYEAQLADAIDAATGELYQPGGFAPKK